MRNLTPRRRSRPNLEPLEGRLLLATFLVTDVGDSGAGTLRQAILDANAAAGTDAIAFAIPGAGPHTIRPTSALPAITDPVQIDGFTQPGSRPNDLANGNDAVIEIGLDGSNAGLNVDGLDIQAGGSLVRGLAITGFTGTPQSPPPVPSGILLEGAGGDRIEGNWIGVDVNGAAAGNGFAGIAILAGSTGNTIGGTTPDARNVISANVHNGVYVTADGNLFAGNFVGTDPTGGVALKSQEGLQFTGASNNTIGGPTAAARNVISGNGEGGLVIDNAIFGGPKSVGNVVQGNFVGTDVTGTLALGNSTSTTPDLGNVPAIAIGGDANTIGGAAVGAGNLISGNEESGLHIYGHITSFLPSTGLNNLVQGNKIGTDVTGTRPLGNGGKFGGVNIEGTTGNTIGGATAAEGNLIAFNSVPGIHEFLYSPTVAGNLILSNSIHDNTGAGIVGNPPAAPTLTSATPSGGSTTVQGTLASVPGTTFTIQFFSDTAASAEGRTLLGQTTATTDASGNASFSASLPVVVPPAQVITATATNTTVGTSAFSAPVAYVVDLAIALAGGSGPAIANGSVTNTITVSNAGPGTATGVIVTDVLPAGVTFVSSTAGSYNAATNTLVVALNSLAPAASATVQMVFRPSAAGTIVNTARVTSDQSDPTPSDNTATLATAVSADGPRVLNLQPIGNRRQTTRLVLTFDSALTASRARKLGNYSLKLVRPGRKTVAILLRSAVYDQGKMTVTLRPCGTLDASRTYVLTVRGTPPRGLTNRAGIALDGRGDGQPGTNYVATVARPASA